MGVEGGVAGLAVAVAGLLHATEREVGLGADRARVHVDDARLEVAHRAEGRVGVAREDRVQVAATVVKNPGPRLWSIKSLNKRVRCQMRRATVSTTRIAKKIRFNQQSATPTTLISIRSLAIDTIPVAITMAK